MSAVPASSLATTTALTHAVATMEDPLTIHVGAGPDGGNVGLGVASAYHAFLAACRRESSARARSAWGLPRVDVTWISMPTEHHAASELRTAIEQHLSRTFFLQRDPIALQLCRSEADPLQDPAPQPAPEPNPSPNPPDSVAYVEVATVPSQLPEMNHGVDSHDRTPIDEWLPDIPPLPHEIEQLDLSARLVSSEEIAMLLDEQP